MEIGRFDQLRRAVANRDPATSSATPHVSWQSDRADVENLYIGLSPNEMAVVRT
jgi:hypothetical protein